MKSSLLLTVSLLLTTYCSAQNLGIGTITPNPAALLHVELGTSTTKGFLVTGTYDFNSTVPSSGAGGRVMFYPGKGAFRAGVVTGTQWDDINVGQLSTALGFNTIANYLGTAMGYHATASGSAAIAIGQNSTASGFHSIVLGENNLAPGNNGICIGNSTQAAGTLSIAMGTNTAATAIFSTAIGKNTLASGENTTAVGHYTMASGTNATSFGTYTKAKGYSSTVIGMYNDSILTSNQTVVTPTTPLFIIGNGDNISSRTNAMVVQKNGNVGFGITPTEKLHVAGNGIFTGTVTANCGVLVCSDLRYKKNIVPVKNTLNNLLHLQSIYYYWDTQNYPAKGFNEDRQIGFAAQELEQLFPEMVHTDEGGYKSVDYSKLTPVLVEALKEQQELIHKLQTQMDLQQIKIEQIEKQLSMVSSE